MRRSSAKSLTPHSEWNFWTPTLSLDWSLSYIASPGLCHYQRTKSEVWSQKAQRGAQRNKIQAEEALHKLHFLAGCSLLSLCVELWFHCEILRLGIAAAVEVRVCFQWRREGSSRETQKKWSLRFISRHQTFWRWEGESISRCRHFKWADKALGVNMTRRAHCLFTCLRPFAPHSITERALLLQIERKLCAQSEK